MNDTDRVNRAMATLMPTIRKAFKRGIDPHPLSSVMRVDQRESALNVRLPDPAWSEPGDHLGEPTGPVELALRLCRNLEFSVERNPAALEGDIQSFGEHTGKAYIRVVLERLVASARPMAAGTIPDADELRRCAKLLGLPCRVVAGPTLHHALQELSDNYVDKVVLERDWPPHRALVMLSTSDGPWVEELEPEFLLEWEPKVSPSVRLLATRRIFLHNEDMCFLYEPPTNLHRRRT